MSEAIPTRAQAKTVGLSAGAREGHVWTTAPLLSVSLTCSLQLADFKRLTKCWLLDGSTGLATCCASSSSSSTISHLSLALLATFLHIDSNTFGGLVKDRDLKQKEIEILVVKCCTKRVNKAFIVFSKCDFELELRGVDVSGTRGWNSNMDGNGLMHTQTHTIILRMVTDVVEVCWLLCSCDVHLMSEWFTTSSPFQLNGACRNKSKCVQVSKVSMCVYT